MPNMAQSSVANDAVDQVASTFSDCPCSAAAAAADSHPCIGSGHQPLVDSVYQLPVGACHT